MSKTQKPELTSQELMQNIAKDLANAENFLKGHLSIDPKLANNMYHISVDKFIIEHLLKQERQIAWLAKELDKFRNGEE